jgi:hypothetical protein
MTVTTADHWQRWLLLPLLLSTALAAKLPSGASPSLPRMEKTIHVSKLGDNSDGSSWAKAFRTVQAALDAVPDDRGGYRIVVRPDTYLEANLFPAHRGAAGAPNELVGDWDGRLGSGTSGWVVLDAGDATKGFKSYDWWGTIRAYKKAWSPEHQAETFSSIGWDRWILRRLYATGGDAGPDGFVMAYESNDPRFPAFTVKFATSTNLTDWIKLPGVYFGTDRVQAEASDLSRAVARLFPGRLRWRRGGRSLHRHRTNALRRH